MALIEDPLGSLVTLLLADADVLALVDTRGFGGDLPESEADNMPRKCFVVRYAGSGTLEAAGLARLQEPRIDILCYGENFFEADRVRRAVFNFMRTLQRTSQGTTLIHRSVHSGGPTQFRDPDTEWPVIFETYLVAAATEATA